MHTASVLLLLYVLLQLVSKIVFYKLLFSLYALLGHIYLNIKFKFELKHLPTYELGGDNQNVHGNLSLKVPKYLA